MKLLLVILAISLNAVANAVGTITLEPGESVTLTPGEPITAVCQFGNPNAKSCAIATCRNNVEYPLRIVDEKGNNQFANRCFKTVTEAHEAFVLLKKMGQCR
ncbi:MAG: hypothetical protein ACKOA8_11100 [Deltaproteobacteria bacterium]